MNRWIDELAELVTDGDKVVLVTVARIRGSAPREPGAKMIVTAEATIGTIGGGQLEYQCTRIACDMLDGSPASALRRFPLGSSMGQCCGGVVDVLFEPVGAGMPGWLEDLRGLHGQREPAALVTHPGDPQAKFVVTASGSVHPPPRVATTAIVASARRHLEARATTLRGDGWFFESVVDSDFDVAVFGAGHVGSAVVRALSALDCNIRWIDSRRNVFAPAPASVTAIESPHPELEVAAMPPDSSYLVMTHSHALDYEICARILRRDDAAYCGLIGSVSKRRRFEKRFRAQGIPDRAIDRLVCPIGVAGISGKKPAEIAVATAADVLRSRELAARPQQIPDNVRPLKRRR